MKSKNSLEHQQTSYGLPQSLTAIKYFLKNFSVIFLSLISFSYTQAQIISTFDSPDISQWILEGDGVLIHDPINGLPGGCIYFDDPANGAISVMTIPPSYFGIWNDDDQEISFDMKVVTSDNDEIEGFPWVIEISGPGGTAQSLSNYIAPHNTWLNITVPVNEANWTVLSGNWEDLLANVNQVRLRVEYIGGVEDTYIDNVALSFTPGANEISGDVCSEFETYGFDGWTFADVASITYSETEGNPAGVIKIGDKSNAISKAFAPWKFLGDWSVLGANAMFHFDLRVNGSASLYMAKEYLVKISGTGGTAIIPPDYVEIAEAKNQWKTFSIPVNPTEWTITSGTWEGIMSNVQQLVLELEFIQGTETVLLDNVCLITDNSSCTADGGIVSPATATKCAKDTYTMSSTGFTSDPSATFQWMISTTPGGPYTNVTGGSGATTTTYTTDKLTNGTFYYVLQTTCAGSGTDLSNELKLIVNSQPSATITPAGPTTFCDGNNVVLNAPTGANRAYQWKKGSDIIEGATLSSYTANKKGNYKVTVTNTSTGCIKTSPDPIKVTEYAQPDAIITPQGPTTFCEGGSVVLQANTGGGLTYKWKKGSNFISGATLSSYTVTAQGNYKVEVTNGNGCTKLSEATEVTVPCKQGESVTASTDYRVSIFPNPASAEINIEVARGEEFEIEITSVSGERMITEQNQTSLNISNLAAGMYFIKISTAEYSFNEKLVKQ